MYTENAFLSGGEKCMLKAGSRKTSQGKNHRHSPPNGPPLAS